MPPVSAAILLSSAVGRAAARLSQLLGRSGAVLLIVCVAAAFLCRFAAMVWLPLTPEEAYYWTYAQHPSLSYYDHPPMVAWLIGAGTALLGNTELGVRLVGGLLMLGASALLYQFGRMWFSRPAGLLAAAAIQILPLYFGAGLIATMDSSLMFFWALGMVGISYALQRGRPWGWYLAGLALGGMLLSKYTGAAFFTGVGLAVVVHRPWRRQLLSIHPWLALLPAAACFSPVLVWNFRHEWVSFRFQLYSRFDQPPNAIRNLTQFLSFQLLALTPVVLWDAGAMLARLGRAPRRLLRGRHVLAISLGLPLLAVLAYKSLATDIHVNWTLPAHLGLLPAVTHELILRWRRGRTLRRKRIMAFGWVATACLCASITGGYLVYSMTASPGMPATSHTGPWPQLAVIVQEYVDRVYAQTGREPLVIGDGRYRLASVLGFYRTPLSVRVRATDYTTSQWPLGGEGLGYAHWSTLAQWIGRDVVLVVDSAHADIFLETKGRLDSLQMIEDPRLAALSRGRIRMAVGRNLRPEPATPQTGSVAPARTSTSARGSHRRS